MTEEQKQKSQRAILVDAELEALEQRRKKYKAKVKCLDQEEWRPCVQTDTMEVSNRGRVRSTKTGRLRWPYYGKDGYLRVRDSKSNSHFLLHRLVAEAFLGPKPDNHHTSILSKNKADCSVENIAYKETPPPKPRKPPKEKDPNALPIIRRGRKHGAETMTTRKVQLVWENVNKMSANQISKALKVPISNVKNILSGIAWDWIDHPNKAKYREERALRKKNREQAKKEKSIANKISTD